jgi:hypothetical protein
MPKRSLLLLAATMLASPLPALADTVSVAIQYDGGPMLGYSVPSNGNVYYYNISTGPWNIAGWELNHAWEFVPTAYAASSLHVYYQSSEWLTL